MNNDLNIHIFRQVYSLRVQLLESLGFALDPAEKTTEKLKTLIHEFETISNSLVNGKPEQDYRSFAIAASIFIGLAEWYRATRNVESDAKRFLDAAKLKVSELESSSVSARSRRLDDFLNEFAHLNNVEQVPSLLKMLTRWPLPLLLSSVQKSLPGGIRSSLSGHKDRGQIEQPSVAFLKFNIDGKPAQKWNYLTSNVAYDLSIEARVSNWPDDATKLKLIPVTIDPLERDWLPVFEFTRPEGGGPHHLTGTGRANLRAANSFGSRPYEFLYAAEFDRMDAKSSIQTVGHRRLVIEGSDSASNPVTGFTNFDHRLLAIRDQLRSLPGLAHADLPNVMTMLGGLGSVAGVALREAIFEANTSEQQFQQELVRLLRMRPEIGQTLQGHPSAAGGITDLTFHDIPIELKAEKSKVIYPSDCRGYFDQTAAYSIALGKRVGVVVVLESSEKRHPIGDPEDDISVFTHHVGQSFVTIIAMVIRGGLPKPSSYSK